MHEYWHCHTLLFTGVGMKVGWKSMTRLSDVLLRLSVGYGSGVLVCLLEEGDGNRDLDWL